MSDIRAWLHGLDLDSHAEAFEAEHLDLESVTDLTEADLRELGIPMGPRKKLLRAIDDLRTDAPQTRAPVSTPREAERRQITVMFCDLVGSTALSETLDPEDLRTLMQSYQQACGAVIERYDGHVAQYLGDGLMTYFGWPRAHEDDAERAVRAGLEIVDAVKTVEAPSPLQVRIGIATGPVVVGETGAGDASVPKLAVGETPNLAARLQGLAKPDRIVIGPTTRRLIGATFDLDDLGEHTLKGIVEPVNAWRVVDVSQAEGRFEATRGANLTPFVGREAEMTLLTQKWEQAKDGEGQVVLMSGEPGIGKSRITQRLRETLADERHTRLRYQCSPYHINSALYPVIEQLTRAAGFAPSDDTNTKLDKLEHLVGSETPTVTLIANLLGIETDRYPPLNMSPQKQKDETLKAIADQLDKLAETSPVLMTFEDAHWIDPTSQKLLDLTVPRVAAARVLLLIIFRPEYTPPWTGALGHVAPLALSRLGRRQAASMIETVLGEQDLPEDIRAEIVAKTDGVPLFVEELTKSVIESGAEAIRGKGRKSHSIPETLKNSLMSRIDHLDIAKDVAQVGACIGRDFSYQLIAAVADLEEPVLNQALDVLQERGLVTSQGKPPDTIYTFKHALVRDAAYDTLLRTRRQNLHRRIANTLSTQPPDSIVNKSELLALHYTEACVFDQAMRYWLEAGRASARRSANFEAITQLRNGLELAATIDDPSKRHARELEFHSALGAPLIAAVGYTTEETFSNHLRTVELAESANNLHEQYPALYGLWAYYAVSGHIPESRQIADKFMKLASDGVDSDATSMAHRLLGSSQVYMGELEAGRRNIEVAIETSSAKAPQDHGYSQDPLTAALAFLAWTLWLQGYPAQAEAATKRCLADVDAMGHRHTRAYVVNFAINLPVHISRDIEKALRMGTEMDTHDELHVMTTLAFGRCIRGWGLSQTGDTTGGLKEIRDGLTQIEKGGYYLWKPIALALQSEVYLAGGQVRAANDSLGEAFSEVDKRQLNWLKPELQRISGEINIEAGNLSAAERDLEHAVATARSQSSMIFCVRSASALTRLWQSQGKHAEAHDLLAPIYNWFTEGFDTADLKDARALLDELEAR